MNCRANIDAFKKRVKTHLYLKYFKLILIIYILFV